MLQHLTASCCLIPARTIMDLLPASTVRATMIIVEFAGSMIEAICMFVY